MAQKQKKTADLSKNERKLLNEQIKLKIKLTTILDNFEKNGLPPLAEKRIEKLKAK